MGVRTPGDAANGIAAGVPSSKDHPFWGMAQGPAGPDAMGGQRGISQTLLNGTLTNSDGAATHPYQQMELLNKIFNNVTTRSNTFAVWLTVGFFPVTNDQVQPNQLGPEINLINGRNIRHHMFAIVDRTQIVTFGNLNPAGPGRGAYQRRDPRACGFPATTAAASISLPSTTITDPPLRTGHTWQIQGQAPGVQGTILVYDPGTTNEETVVVQNNGGVLTANFTKGHATAGVVNVISRGHPGPMNIPKYTGAISDPFVVPYAAIID